MIYAGIDVNIITHPKALACGVEALGLWTWGMCYAQLHETNGHLPRVAVLTAMGGRRNIMLAKRLVESGLWAENEDGSWQVYNYGRKNQTAEEIRRKKEQSAERVRAWRERRNAPGNANVTLVNSVTERVRTDPSPSPDNTTRKHHQKTEGIGAAAPLLSLTEPITKVRRKRKPETACPSGEVSEAETKLWAVGWKIPVDHPEFWHFLLHHRAKESLFRDWHSAWGTWLQNGKKFGGGRAVAHVQSGDNRAWKIPEEMP